MSSSGPNSTDHRQYFRRFLRFYNQILTRHKYPVQIVTGGALWFAGDILCQTLVHFGSDGSEEEDEEKDKDKNRRKRIEQEEGQSRNANYSLLEKTKDFRLDWTRIGRMTCYGMLVSAPTYAFWYSFLDKWSHRQFHHQPILQSSTEVILPRGLRHFLQRVPILDPLRPTLLNLWSRKPAAATLRTWKIIGFKLAADTLLFDPAYLSLFFTATSVMEGRSAAEIGRKLRQDLLPTYLVDIAVWLPIQTINFRWVPVIYQALIVQSCNVGWNAYLSFVQHNNHDQ